MKGIWEKAKNMISEAVFPSNIYCIRCGSLIDGSRPYSLCDKCAQDLHWTNGRTCEKCGKALHDTYKGKFCYDCMTYKHAFEKGYSCFTYGLHERKLLFDYKYNGKGYLADKFGDILYDRISCEDVHVDVIIPIPVGKKRLKQRGYNQSALMARRLSKRWGVPADERIIFRTTETPRLRNLSPIERENVLTGAFSIFESGKQKIKNRKIMLVDDIYTTGATADACSKILIESGAAAVFVLTLASGGNRKPKEQ